MSNPDWLTAIKNSPVAKLNPHLFQNTPPKAPRRPRKSSKEVLWITGQIKEWCAKNCLELILEFRFHAARKYRFDFFIPALSLGIEYQGGVFMKKSGHTNAKGATRDCEKMNLAQSMGYRVLTFTAINAKDVIQELEKFK